MGLRIQLYSIASLLVIFRLTKSAPSLCPLLDNAPSFVLGGPMAYLAAWPAFSAGGAGGIIV